ncbi:beta-1,4-galactosyltransferase 1 [Seriola lalandi dorsalis]|uniref:Beta-1,4-galactosyltransferase n=1 Tax=Seriola lalandi dorsalis TaxID=1841481 RepID=A0A3B4XYY9_SERLL|nr:beta-1,4-galactosyltransferase 1 [Seriola lalandi dorsalis]XP_056239201.1 beta-1,4-galactosyltransferase 1 [Seriola aureovittata]
MPGDSSVNFNLLHRTCKLVVLLCFLHISVTVVFYVRSLDIRFAFVQNQQSSNNATQRNHLRNTGFTSRAELKKAESKRDGPEAEPRDEPQPPQHHPEAKRTEEPEKKLQKCPETSPLLVGPLRVEFNTPVTLEQIKKDNPDLQLGGRSRPRDCEALQKVAIIIPFRNREEHLKYWLYYLHPILHRQQLDYGVYVINQDGDEIFNRAKLLNVGYMEALKDYDYNCFVFSDVDLIPMDDRNTYRCFGQPRHLSVSMDKFGFRLPYNQYFGGVSSMSKEQYLKINGFPNNYWGWGGEDDDIYNRLASKGMSISRPSGEVGKCRMIRHQRDKQNEPNPQRFDRIAHTRETMHKDGINSLSYRVVKIDKFDLFTQITVDVGKP